MADIIRSPGALDTLTTNFLQAFQMSRQLQQQKQQLDLERQRTQAQIGSEQASAGEARARTKQLDLAAEDLENQQAGVRLAMGHLANLDDDKAFAADLQNVDPAVAAHAITARNALLKSQTDIQESREQLKETQARAQNLMDEHTINQMIMPTVTSLLKNPNAPLPKDPNTAQSVAMSRLGVLSYITQRMAREQQRAGENAQADLAARQAVMQAYGAATNKQMERSFVAGDTTSFQSDFQDFLKPLGIDTTAATAMVQEALGSFMRRHAVGGSGAPIGAPTSLEPMFNAPRFRGASPQEQHMLLDAAYGVAAGKPLSASLDAATRAWILNAARLMKASQRSVQAQP